MRFLSHLWYSLFSLSAPDAPPENEETRQLLNSTRALARHARELLPPREKILFIAHDFAPKRGHPNNAPLVELLATLADNLADLATFGTLPNDATIEHAFKDVNGHQN